MGVVAATWAADFLLLLPIRTSSCLFRSSFVRAANSSATSFCEERKLQKGIMVSNVFYLNFDLEFSF